MSNNALSDYIKSIYKYPLLEPEQTLDLSHKVQAMIVLVGCPSKPIDNPVLNEDEKIIVAIGRKAFKKLTESNLRLVVKIAKKYQNRGLDLLTLIQLGNMGLMRGIELFNPNRGKFSSYVSYWIKQHIARGITNTSRTIRLPIHIHDDLEKIKNRRSRFFAANHREPTLEELATICELKTETIKHCLASDRTLISLDYKPSDKNAEATPGNGGLRDVLAIESESDSDLKLELDLALSSLDPIAEDIIRKWMALDFSTDAVVCISRDVNMSKAKVQGIIIESLKRLESMTELREYL